GPGPICRGVTLGQFVSSEKPGTAPSERQRSETGLSPRFFAQFGCNRLASWVASRSSERGPAARSPLRGGLETPPSFAGQTLVSKKLKPWAQ
ncbi:MAG: hypothetical protein U9Q79_12600, partial [Candidatus Hydrogenedentes bacterium]|nr:hypothetical protein [Candidatus Hydrogenedentota bacterium]